MRRRRQRRYVDVLVTLLQVANFKAEVAIFSNVVTSEIVFQTWLCLWLPGRRGLHLTTLHQNDYRHKCIKNFQKKVEISDGLTPR